MLNVWGQQHLILTHERMFFWKCRSFWDTNVSNWGGLELPTFGFMPNALLIWAIRAKHFLVHVSNTGPGGMDIFLSKINIWTSIFRLVIA